MESTFDNSQKLATESGSAVIELQTSAKCRVSGGVLQPFLNFGPMPIANGFLTESEVAAEPYFPLEVGFCEESLMVQLTQQVPPEAMFHDAYAFFSSTSRKMSAHFRDTATWVHDHYVDNEAPLVAELGSNDGIFLHYFAECQVPHLGIEPSANVAEVARSKGVRTVSEFFGCEQGRAYADSYGAADVIFAANVMCHIPDLNSVAEGVAHWLKPQGVLIFEDPYLGDILNKTSYDQIYDEHAFYFCGHSVQRWVERHGLELVDLIPQSTHGGSMRYVIARRGSRPVSEAVQNILSQERASGIDRLETYVHFAEKVEASKERLMEMLELLRDQRKKVAGYGATSKSTTVTNYCGITPDHVAYIADTTPIKQGKLSPGAHIPVVSHERFVSEPPDVTLLFAWNHAEEIMSKETEYTASGGKWLTYVPEVKLQ